MQKVENPPDRSWASHSFRQRFGKRKRTGPPIVVPDSYRNYDLWEMLQKCIVAQVHTIDGMVIHVERTDATSVDLGAGRITGLKFGIWFLGEHKIVENVTCQQHFSAWKLIDPNRRGQRWWFVLHETSVDGTKLNHRENVVVVGAV